MASISRRGFLGSLMVGQTVALPGASEWTPLFDGKSLNGWKASENPASWKVVNGTLAAEGPRSHLFYTGREFKNFELMAEVMTRPGANSGIYFHTRYQESGWPKAGFEVQVNNTHVGEGNYRERKKTGSLYGVRNVYKAFARDDEWFTMHIVVRGKQVQVRVNDLLLVDYIDAGAAGQPLNRGTFALQGHDPHSRVLYRNIRVRELPDDARADTAEEPVADDHYRELIRLGAQNYPVVDYHVHLRPGMAIEDLLRKSRRDGVFYGVAVNVGLKFPVHDDAGARAFLDMMKGRPVFLGLQGEGREWVDLVSKETMAQFDYIFTDAMTWTDDSGKRMRLWIRNEVGEIADTERFMETYVKRAVGILKDEPIDVFVSPTFLPDVLLPDYEKLWTPSRMERIIQAAVNNDVAIELNDRYKLPSAAFVQMAKKAGAKFTLGTNNGSAAELGRCEYGVRMIRECGLQWQDFFVPKPDGEKAAQRRRRPSQ
jgi:hypothetical protein